MGGTLGGQIGTGATGHQVLAENGLKINSDLPFFFFLIYFSLVYSSKSPILWSPLHFYIDKSIILFPHHVPLFTCTYGYLLR